MATDPYQILGVSKTATQDDIRSAYRKLAKKWHPDVNKGDKAAEERFKAISSANDILGDPDRRAQYDRGEIGGDGEARAPQGAYRQYSNAGGYSSAQGFGADDIGVNDIFSELFRGAGGGGAPRASRGRDIAYTMSVSFADSITGAQERLTLPDGRTIDVRVPPGLEDRQTLRLRGQGGEGYYGGPAGDALIEVRVLPHPFFRREGNDVLIDLPITLKEAVLGAKVPVPTVTGTVTLTVPKRSDTGGVLRLRGRGVPAGSARPAGDQKVTLRVTAADADDALAAFLETWTPSVPRDPRSGME